MESSATSGVNGGGMLGHSGAPQAYRLKPVW